MINTMEPDQRSAKNRVDILPLQTEITKKRHFFMSIVSIS